MACINIYDTDDQTGERTLEGWFDLDTTEEFNEAKRYDGNNLRGVISGGQIGYEKLHRTKGGRWILESNFTSECNGHHLWAFLPDDGAKEWLLRSEYNDDAVEKYFGPIDEEKGPGRPEIGPAFSLRFPAELLERVDARAKDNGVSRAELVRQLVAAGLPAKSAQSTD